MTKILGYRVDENLKDDYENFIINEYGNKNGKCGNSVSNLMKLEMALSGDSKYINDPNVKELLDTISKKMLSTDTHEETDNNSNSNINVEKEIKEIKETLFKIQDNVVNTKEDSMYAKTYINDFGDKFKDSKEITENELTKYIMQKENVLDPRPIKQRLMKLEAEGLIKRVAPKVYTNINYTPKIAKNEFKDIKTVSNNTNLKKSDFNVGYM
jgi:hypothetical protein